MLKIKDINVNNKGVFNYMEDLEVEGLINTLGGDNLDNLLFLKYGNKGLSTLTQYFFINEMLTEDKIIELANFILINYEKRWELEKTIIENNLLDVGFRIEKTENINTTNTDGILTTTNKNNTENISTSAFDSVDYSGTDKVENLDVDSIVSDTETLNIKSLTHTLTGSKDSVIDDKVKTIKFLENYSMQNVIINDVVELVGNLIY
jgi:hypothetical protein